MSLPPYAEYIDSGVEWLGALPAHWTAPVFKRTVRLLTEKTERRESPVALENVESGTGRFIQTETKFEGEGVAFEAGDILFGKLRPYLAKAWLADRAGEAVGDFHVLRPMDTTIGRFSQYVILNDSCISIIDGSTFGAKMPRASWDFMGTMRVPEPPLSEQIAIAAFLDRETGKIDALVAEQEKLIALLKEKRQTVISHAVTKGLNPDAPIKPSGVEWLGDVPAHWEVKQIRHFAEVLRGKFTHRPRNDPAFYDGPYPFIQTGDITGVSRTIVDFKQTLNERGISVSRQFPKGTLVMAIAANIGDVAILDFPAYFPDSIVGLLPSTQIDLMFLFYLMLAMKQPMLMTATVSTQMNLNVDQIVSLNAASPPIAEQRSMVLFLDRELVALDTLTAEAVNAITLLKERRSALISAAVTGQIDVRGLVSRAEAA